MNEENISKDTVNEIVKRIDGNLKGIKNDLNQIKTQTKITNSRVNKLEDWRATVRGALLVMNIFLVPIVICFMIIIVKYLAKSLLVLI